MGAMADQWTRVRDEIQERVPCAQLLAQAGIQGHGNRYPCPNPAHPPGSQDQRPDLALRTETNSWQCYSCGQRGSVFDLAVFLGLAADYSSALRELAAVAGVELPINRPPTRRAPHHDVPADRALGIRSRFMAACQRQFSKSCPAATYLAGRGIPYSVARDCGCGFVADREAAKIALARKYTVDELMAAGLWSKRRKPMWWRHQLLIPTGPIPDGLAMRICAPSDSALKELAAGEGVFGLAAIADRFSADPSSVPYLAVCEGTTDWLAAVAHDVPAVGVPGCARWSSLLRHLDLLPPVPILIVFDHDPPRDGPAAKDQGPENAFRAARALRDHGRRAVPLIPPLRPDNTKADLSSMIDDGHFGPSGRGLPDALAALAECAVV